MNVDTQLQRCRSRDSEYAYTVFKIVMQKEIQNS